MAARVLLASLALFFVASFGVLVYADTSLNQVFAQIEQEYKLPAGVLAKIANVESNGNPTAGNPAKAYGLFQWFPQYWYEATRALYGSYVNASERANPTVAAKVTAFTLKQAQNKNGALIQQARLDPILGLYMCHFLGSGGCSRFFQEYIKNPGADATALFQKEAAYNRNVFNGRTLTGVLNFFAQRLKVAGASLTLAGNFTDRNGVSLAYSNADLSSRNFMSPGFAPPTDNQYRTYPTTYSSQPQTLQAPTQLTQPAPVSQLPSAQSATSTSSATPQALILVQPASVKRGDVLLVAWSSVGVSLSTPCNIRQDGSLIAEQNSGSKIVQTGSASTGAMTFTMSCTAVSGRIERSTTVMFR